MEGGRPPGGVRVNPRYIAVTVIIFTFLRLHLHHHFRPISLLAPIQTPYNTPYNTHVIGVHARLQGMKRRTKAPSSRPHVDAKPTADRASPPVQVSFADVRRDFNRAYNQFYLSGSVDQVLQRKISEYDITVAEFEKLTLTKQYQRYITLEEGKIRFDEMPTSPHGEIAGLLSLMIARQVEGADNVAVLVPAVDNGTLFVNSPNGHRLQIE